jgi:hypothetical protein
LSTFVPVDEKSAFRELVVETSPDLQEYLGFPENYFQVAGDPEYMGSRQAPVDAGQKSGSGKFAAVKC